MFAYIGKNLINLNKILSISIFQEKYVKDNIEILYEDSKKTYFSETPEKDLENIFQMTKDSE